jgi:hypothetical protein
MGCGTLTGAGVLVGLVVVVDGEGVVVVRPVAAPVLPVVDVVVVPPVLWPMTASGISRPKATAVVLALTQIFEAIPPPSTAHIMPPKLRGGCEQRDVPSRPLVE